MSSTEIYRHYSNKKILTQRQTKKLKNWQTDKGTGQ